VRDDVGYRTRRRRPGLRPTFGLSTRRDSGEVHRRCRSRGRLAVQNDTRREQPGHDNTNMPRSVTRTHDLRVVPHHAGDETAASRHHFRHHRQKARRFRTGPDLHLRWWRGQDLNLRPSGYEPAQRRTFWSRVLPCSTADEAIREALVTSTPVLSRPVRQRTAPFTAPRAMQAAAPRRRATVHAASFIPLPRPMQVRLTDCPGRVRFSCPPK